jgi:uncharacterized membrane protein
MSKKKKKKVPKRPHTLPKDYLIALSDKLHMQNPQKEIIYNTLVDVYTNGYTNGYTRRINDATFTKEKQEKHITDDFNKFKDEIDDIIHNKTTNQ